MSRLLSFALLLGLIAGSFNVVRADEINPRGKPSNFEPGKAVAYFLWRDRDGWHLRTTTSRRLRRFRGAFEVDAGEIESVTNAGSEAAGLDWAKRSRDKKKVVFDLKTDGQSDGLNFTVSADATSVTFTFLVDEENAPTERIFIGADGAHPDSSDFTLPARGRQ